MIKKFLKSLNKLIESYNLEENLPIFELKHSGNLEFNRQY